VPRIVDLTLDIYDGAPVFDPDPKTSVTPALRVADLGYNMTRLEMATHVGTHLDAPYHFFDDGRTVENLDLARCIGPALVLDLRHKRPQEEIAVGDMEPWEAQIGPGSRLIFHTGWYRVFPERRYFSDQPYLGAELCRWLVERGVRTIALDMPTTYPKDYMTTHHILLGAEVLIIEGLCRLDELRAEQVILIALPLRIRGRDGSPCRVVAIEGALETDFAGFFAP
jgi:kynurenine formamidase